MYYVYLLKSSKHSQLYTGFTTDLRKRIDDHNNGLSNYTKAGRPWKLVYYEAYTSEKEARKRERSLKLRGNAYAQLRKRISLSVNES